MQMRTAWLLFIGIQYDFEGGKKKRRTEKQETVFKQCTNRIIQSDDLQIAEKIFITLQGNIFSDFP